MKNMRSWEVRHVKESLVSWKTESAFKHADLYHSESIYMYCFVLERNNFQTTARCIYPLGHSCDRFWLSLFQAILLLGEKHFTV